MLLHFKDKETKKEYSLQLKKGNDKPIDKDVYIINLESAYYCCNKECEYHKTNKACCYALANEIQFKNTIIRALKDMITIDYLVKNDLWELLANEIIKASQRSKKHKIKHLRVGERGELKTLKHLIFINNVSEILYNKLGVSTTIYTHKEALYDEFKSLNIQSKGLIIIGSGFMGDIQFDASKELNPNNKYNCYSNCLDCKQLYGVPLCYDLKLKNKGVVITEKLRENNKKLNLTLPQHIKYKIRKVLKYYS